MGFPSNTKVQLAGRLERGKASGLRSSIRLSDARTQGSYPKNW